MRLAAQIILGLALATACSVQSRDTDPGVSGDEVLAQLGQLTSAGTPGVSGAQGSGDADTVNTWAQDPNSTVYYARGYVGGPMGPPATVAAFADYSIFGRPGVVPSQVPDVQVYFVDNQGQDGLLVALSNGDGTNTVSVFISTGAPTTSSDGFSATLVNNATGDQITVETDDVDSGGNLLGTIQLRVYDASGDFIGQFSVLAGFRH